MASLSGSCSQWLRHLFLGLLLLALSSRINGLAITYCSDENTANGFQSVYNMYQTNGACQDTCGNDYVYAVIQGAYCWCSNDAPASQTSTYDCNQVCPGFGSEWCGNTDQGLYGYFQLGNRAPSGTVGGASSSSVQATSASRSPSPSVSNTPSRTGSSPSTILASSGDSSSLTMIATVQSVRTSISIVEQTSTIPVIVPDTTTSSTSSSDSSTQSPTTTTAPPEVFTTTVTGQGTVRTVVSTPTPSTDSTLGSSTPINSSGGGGVSTGKVVGIVLGVALGLGLIIGLGVWYWLRRRHQRNLEAASFDGGSSHNANIPSRQVSQMSSAGLLGKAPRIITSGLPHSNNPRSADTSSSGLDRRSLGTDQRLNPYAIYAHEESRHSNVSLQDNQDYSRQLRVANPDP